MSISPFEDKTFIKLMDAILEQCKNKVNVLLCAIGEVNKETDPVSYYTLDCALCYYTYKNINKGFNPEIKKLESRINKNIQTMEIYHKT